MLAENLATLILTIKAYLQLRSPRELYIPYLIANTGKKGLVFLLRFLRKFGLKADLPPELMFLDNFYKSQALSTTRLKASSFVDPAPEETIFTQLPDLITYYLTRWSHQNLITSYDKSLQFKESVAEDFDHNPVELLKSIHSKSIAPFPELIKE